MGRQLIKVARDVDLYMEWSSVVEAPLYISTREEMRKDLARPIPSAGFTVIRGADKIEEMLDTADQYGAYPNNQFTCTWDDSGEIFEQRGLLPRRNMEAFARLIVEADDYSAMTEKQWNRLMALLEPFEDETEVRTKRHG